jgi:hypothetical protein
VRRTSHVLAGAIVVVTACTAVPARADTVQQTHITAQLSTSKISIGQAATVTGHLTADTESGTVPLANEPVLVYLLGSGRPAGQATTDGNGDYSYKIVAAPGSLGQVTVFTDFNDTGADPAYTSASSASLPLRVPVTRSFSGGEISADAYGDVTLAGSLYPELKPGAPVSIQFSPNGSSQWKQVAVAHADSNGYFRGTGYSGHSGWWRAYYAGDADDYPIAVDNYKNWRWNTHFTGFKAKRAGSKVKVTGTLIRYFSTSRKGGFAGQTVQIIFRFKGKKTWYLIGHAKTNSKGQFSKKVKHYGKGYYVVLFQGTSTTWASSTAKSIYVRSAPATPSLTLDSPLPTGVPAAAPLILHTR